jgi:hypothetical protein
MTNAVLTAESEAQVSAATVSDVSVTADEIRESALAFVREKLTALQRGLDLIGLIRRSEYFEIFKHGLAIGVANALARYDQRVLAVYTYELQTNTDVETGEAVPLNPTLNMLLLVSTPSAALDAFVSSLDRALLASLKELALPVLKQRDFILEVNVVTQLDIQYQIGYAKLLSSVFVPPLKVWQREE